MVGTEWTKSVYRLQPFKPARAGVIMREMEGIHVVCVTRTFPHYTHSYYPLRKAQSAFPVHKVGGLRTVTTECLSDSKAIH